MFKASKPLNIYNTLKKEVEFFCFKLYKNNNKSQNKLYY